MSVVAMSVMNPGYGGWLVGGLLVAVAVRLLLGLRRQRRRARRAAHRAAPGVRRCPPQEPRPAPAVDAATMLLPRVRDEADATMLLPVQQGAHR
ncbi:hypothetical protein ABZY58_12125 [Micromonospora tulbaghiae]|uniref:hypothetical protein n=1 Tax=Micromonospora tulbaghiae TaxID=479978 RepID=UPI0033BB5C43